MKHRLRKLQEMGSGLLGLLGLGKSSATDDPAAVPIDIARRHREIAAVSDAELTEFLDRCVEASEIQRLHYATGEAISRLVAGDLECRTSSVVTQQIAAAATPAVSDSGPAMASNLRELRTRVANPFDTADTLMVEAMKKMEEGRRDSDARIKAITQRATELSLEVGSLRDEVAARDLRMSELEQKLADSELARQKVQNQLEDATQQISSLVRDTGAHEATRKRQSRWFLILLGIAAAVVVALVVALAQVNS
jgi:hypothetical protein